MSSSFFDRTGFSFLISNSAGCDSDGAGIVIKKAGSKFDYETRKFIELPVVLFDSGKPQKSATTMVQICIKDEDDNCCSDGNNGTYKQFS